jgi:carbon-monoxide dehydrogenase large subunit
MTAISVGHGSSRSVRRVEDDRLLRGAGRFVDDIEWPGLLHACMVRSPVAHGRLRALDLSAARAHPGVQAVLAYADLRHLFRYDRIPQSIASGMVKFHVDPPWLAIDEVCYVGEPLAIVLATSRAVAEDAARLIEPDIEPLPVVVDPREGLRPGAPRARSECPDNRVGHTVVRYGEVDAAFEAAPHRVAACFRLDKGGGHSMETRGLVARFDPSDERLTVWSSTQMPHRSKALLVDMLGMDEHAVRVVAPDVGGGFGPKAVIHPEELVVPAAARLLGRPIKWIEDRHEAFMGTVLERLQIWDVEAACDDEGRLLAIRGHLFHDHGACSPYGLALPYNAVTNLVGPYVLPAFQMEISLCLTNFVPATPTRGAGRPQGTFVMERLLDRMARRVGISLDEIRRRNLIAAERMPHEVPIVQRDGSTMLYDSGDYPECQRRLLKAADWSGFADRQTAARREGRYIGLGMANYVEATGRGPFESGSVRIGPSGTIIATTGATAQGQGTRSMIAQLVASQLGVEPEQVKVLDGDTDASPLGLGAFASRQAVTAGNAAWLAAKAVADKARQAAATMLEVSADDLELVDGHVQVKGVPEMRRSLAQIGKALGGVAGFALPGGLAPGLAASVDYEPGGLTYTNGSHAAEVEVDVETGAVRLLRYVVVHDCGHMINPMLVEGQVMGGVVHGIGSTLLEWMQYDPEGQPISTTLADYLLPTADGVPPIEIHHMESPTPFNPLGVKGAAESGSIGAPSAIIAAVEAALRPLEVEVCELPLTPPRLLALIRAARLRQAAGPA